ncbi:MarR family winged helix-turn-helix transcriptional regulator [Owenweeksia hongkongensis]|uniref:Transcriptional regulator n=1 Tax=Owenweeksia hongkongensis (strain DSM 17368 / CIP 108786 / JCM 12287 / NRRL B-23963 / UST20020801) TaxID=926562 RepID=G8R849_OWEHD|nr:MarR family transcriptional regulator [Owenweeksia hongkongensis]AEV32417.1 transcriptional regulator [Owenweeksia hongkongensis DSM 17368]
MSMGISEEIKQSKFTSERQKAAINLFYTSNWLSEKLRAFLSNDDLTPQQFNVLRILRGSHPEPLSTLQIRERMLDKMSDTSRIVDRLVKKELVKKGTCKADKRLVDINITENGLDLLSRLDENSQDLDNHLNGISEEEAETLSTILDKIRDNYTSTGDK